MPKPRKAPKSKPEEISYAQAIAELPAAEAALRAESSEYREAYQRAVEELHSLHGIMAKEAARTLLAQRRFDTLRAVVDKAGVVDKDGKPKQGVITYRLIENPFITQGLLDAVANGEVTTRQADQPVAINQMLLVGGLARVKGKTEAQFLAAARYCHLYEVSQIGAAKAIDYEQVRVDTSGPRSDPTNARQDAARREMDNARDALGARAASIVDIVVVYGGSVRSLAAKLGYGEGGQGRRRAERELLQALDVLVAHFKLLPADKLRRWTDGSKAVIARDAEGNILAEARPMQREATPAGDE